MKVRIAREKLTKPHGRVKACKKEKDTQEIFKKDLGTFVRFYEFMSLIVEYNDKDLEKLSMYARNLRPMLREHYPLNHTASPTIKNASSINPLVLSTTLSNNRAIGRVIKQA